MRLIAYFSILNQFMLGGTSMAVLANFIFYAGQAAVFAVLAYAGVMLGKKFRDKKDLQKSR